MCIKNNYTFAANFNPSNNTKMKKFATLIAVAGMFAFVACNGSEDKAKAEKAKQDSIAKADSIKKVNDAKAMQMKQDSAKAAAAKADTTKKDTTKK